MTKLSKLLGLALLILLASGMLSATPVTVGYLSFVHTGGQQYFEMFNETGAGAVPTALIFDNLTLTVTYADGNAPESRAAASASGYAPGAYTLSSEDVNLNAWLWNEDRLITGATLTGTISPNAFQWADAGGTFFSTGILSASLDLSENVGNELFGPTAEITVNDAPAPAPVPEPSTIVLLAGPALAFVARRVRK